MTSLLRQFLRSPGTVASVVPSSGAVAEAMLDPIDFDQARVIVELGPGPGPITRPILERLHPDGVLIAFEINPELVRTLRSDIQDRRLIVLERSAEDVCSAVAALGDGRWMVDAVVSTLAMTTMPAAARDRILSGCRDALWRSGGPFTQILYGIAEHRLDLDRELRRFFPEVQRRAVPWNVPPAFVYAAAGLNPTIVED